MQDSTMKLDKFYSENNGFIQFSREQASDFAKDVAGDFNPIHNVDSKRFCVPGDLLFACSLDRFGLSQNMHFRFSGMVGSGMELDFNPTNEAVFPITNRDQKEYLHIERNGDISRDIQLVEAVTRQCVTYSGQSFPRLLELMGDQRVVVNPKRPLVIYESIQIAMTRMDSPPDALKETECTLTINGKRGEASLGFSLLADGETVGKCIKIMLLSGVRPYEESAMEELVEIYHTTVSARAGKAGN